MRTSSPFSPKIPLVADADMMITNVVIGAIIGDFKPAPPDDLGQIGFRGPRQTAVPRVGVRQGAKYKARPLNGIWATAPYLHNGSVPTSTPCSGLRRAARSRSPSEFSPTTPSRSAT